MTRMLASGMFSARATPVCTPNTPCVDSQMVRRGPSHFATHPCSSIAFCSSHGVVKVCSITTSADLKPASTSPRTYGFPGGIAFPPSRTAGAPGFSASATEVTWGRTS